jgi:hypothetical protein
VQRVLRYLGSVKNIAGCALALVGLVLHFFGLFGQVWPLVVAAMYLIGALVAPPAPHPVTVSVDSFDPDRIQRALDGTVDMARGRVPADVLTRLNSIRARILELLPQAGDLPGGSQDLYVVQRTATDYLPTTVRIYLALPPTYATTQIVQDGKTPLAVLQDQLELLDGQMSEIGEAVHRRDSDRLLAQGRFLEERFGRSAPELRLPPPKK